MNTQKFSGIMGALDDTDAAFRRRAWSDLREALSREDDRLKPEQCALLVPKFLGEQVADVRQFAHGVLLALIVEGRIGNKTSEPSRVPPSNPAESAKPKRSPPQSLAEWLWTPFGAPSFVFGLSAPEFRRRDEDALIYLARRLSQADFPGTDFRSIWMDDPQIDQILNGREHGAVCLVGRPVLFGVEAQQRWCPESVRMHFSFPKGRRRVKPGEVAPRYHKIRFQSPNESRIMEFVCREHKTRRSGRRVDFGIVQRYEVWDGQAHIVVVIIAGATSLGTLGAAIWAASTLFRPFSSDGQPIPCPSLLSHTSQLEALIEVSAELTSRRWEPHTPQLRMLFVDDAEWILQERIWRRSACSEIVLFMGGASGDEIVEMAIGGQKPKFKRDKQLFAIMVRLCEAAEKEAGAGVEFAALARDKFVMPQDGKGHKLSRIRKQVQMLRGRHQLSEMLIVDSGKVALIPGIRIRREPAPR